ncbi:MAG: hypothetical protein O3C40_02240 [Planctomycetota bacterium]|nr:hypothetical protein [Planctomycetota bacterium]
MKSNHRHRPLAFEQLESKAAPSSILLVFSGGDANTELVEVSTSSQVTHSPQLSDYRHETDQILRFIAENTTGGEQAHRPATLPTIAQCAAADEMMGLVAGGANGFFVLGFYDDGTEL